MSTLNVAVADEKKKHAEFIKGHGVFRNSKK